MSSVHSLIQASRQELVDGPHKVHGVILTYKLPGGLRRGSIWALWTILGAVVFLNVLSQWTAGHTLLLSLEYIHIHVEQLSRGKRLTHVFATLVFGRLADIYSRPVASALAVIFFVLGSVISAASPGVAAVIAGTIFHTMGIAGLGLLATLFIADYTSLRWRGAALSWTYIPNLVMTWVAPRFSVDIPWRWTYGIAAILMFVLCAPAGYLLFSAARKTSATPNSLNSQPRRLASHMDLIGLSLFTLGFGLIEYNSAVASTDRAMDKYPPERIAKLTIGLLLTFPVFILWELFGASFPLMPGRILRQRGVLLPVMINFLFWFASVFPTGSLMDFVYFAWTANTVGYLLSTSGIAYAASAPLLGLAYFAIRRHKPFLFLGNVLFALGCGLSLYVARHWNFTATDEVFPFMTYLFATQVLIGIGSAAVQMSALIGAQASVRHDDLAITTTLFFAWSQLATSVCLPIATSISVRLNNPARSTVSFSLALGLSVLCIILSLFIPNHALSNEHNAVEVDRQVEKDSLESQYK